MPIRSSKRLSTAADAGGDQYGRSSPALDSQRRLACGLCAGGTCDYYAENAEAFLRSEVIQTVRVKATSRSSRWVSCLP